MDVLHRISPSLIAPDAEKPFFSDNVVYLIGAI